MFKKSEKQVELSTPDSSDSEDLLTPMPPDPSMMDAALSDASTTDASTTDEVLNVIQDKPRRRHPLFKYPMFASALLVTIALYFFGPWVWSAHIDENPDLPQGIVMPANEDFMPARLELKALWAGIILDRSEQYTALFDLGRLRFAQGNEDDGIRRWLQITEITDNPGGVARELTNRLCKKGRYQDAAHVMDRWIAHTGDGLKTEQQPIDAKFTTMYRMAAEIYAKAGMQQKAEEYAARARRCSLLPCFVSCELQVDPASLQRQHRSNPDATVDQLYYACKLLASGEEQQAEKIFDSLTKQTKDAETRDYARMMLPVSQVSQKKWDAAEKTFEAALEVAKDKLERHPAFNREYEIAAVYEALCTYTKARYGNEEGLDWYKRKIAEIRDIY